MMLALRSGQPFLHLLEWHPRDVDTLLQHYADQDSEQRMEAARQRAHEVRR